MVLDLPPLLQPPLSDLMPQADWRKSFAYPKNIRQVEPSGSEKLSAENEDKAEYRSIDSDEFSGASQIYPYPARNSVKNANNLHWDKPNPIYSPRGAPTDATPALSRLSARISFEPVYVHHYASTRYALVSFMPSSAAERRTRLDILA